MVGSLNHYCALEVSPEQHNGKIASEFLCQMGPNWTYNWNIETTWIHKAVNYKKGILLIVTGRNRPNHFYRQYGESAKESFVPLWSVQIPVVAVGYCFLWKDDSVGSWHSFWFSIYSNTTQPSWHNSIFSCDLKKLSIIHPLLIIQPSEVSFPIHFLFYRALKVDVKEIHFGTPM